MCQLSQGLACHGSVTTKSTASELLATVSQGCRVGSGLVSTGGHSYCRAMLLWLGFGAWDQIMTLLKWVQAVSITFSAMANLTCRWRRGKHKKTLGAASKTAAQLADEAIHLIAVCIALLFHGSAFNVVQLKIVLQGLCRSLWDFFAVFHWGLNAAALSMCWSMGGSHAKESPRRARAELNHRAKI